MIYSCTSFVILSVQKKRKIKLFFKYLKQKKKEKVVNWKKFQILKIHIRHCLPPISLGSPGICNQRLCHI